MEKKGYAGSIPNSGVMIVKAPHAVQSPKGKGIVKKGNDLRTGK